MYPGFVSLCNKAGRNGKTMLKLFILLIVTALFLSAPKAYAASQNSATDAVADTNSHAHADGQSLAFDATQPETPDYWLGRNAADTRDILLYPEEITALNERLQNDDVWLTDMTAYIDCASVPAEFVRQKIERLTARSNFTSTPPTNLFEGGAPLGKERYAAVFNNGNIRFDDSIPLRFAVAKRRANMRILPTDSGWFTSATGTHYDELQATIIDPLEPVVVLADSADGRFLFAVAFDYWGWLKREDLTFVNHDEWCGFVCPKNFLTITANKKTVSFDGEDLLFQMGARLPLVSDEMAQRAADKKTHLAKKHTDFTVLMPGGKRLLIPADDTVNVGYLPLTT